MQPDPSLSQSDAQRVAQLCGEFEQDWQDGQSPKVEDFLGRLDETSRLRLLRPLLLLEIKLRRKAGERPQPGEYRERLPDHDDLIAQLFSETISLPPHEQAIGEGGPLPRAADETLTRAIDNSWSSGPPHALHPESSGVEFGDYVLLEEIARGGMGVVYRAIQKKANRVVALKMILQGRVAGDEEVTRFRAEAEAAANLNHPGIVPIYDVGECEGQQYFSMAFIEGKSLKDRIADGPLPAGAAVRLVRTIAEAVRHAHEKGIIHRDLKPGNILLDVNGDPHVTDFGLAKRIHSDSDLTATGQVLGTPSYMSPEQALGKTDQVDQRSDVYGLGAVLYATLTGRPPHQAANAVDALRAVIELEPLSPRRLDRSIPRDLESICLKCLEKKPRKRYQTAAALTADLTRFLRRQPVSARPIGVVRRSVRWCQRNVIASMLFVTIIVALVVVSLQWYFAERQRGLLDVQNDALGIQKYDLALQVATAHLERNLNDRASEALADTSESLRGWEYFFCRNRASASPYFWHRFDGEAVTACVVHRATSQLVTYHKSSDASRDRLCIWPINDDGNIPSAPNSALYTKNRFRDSFVVSGDYVCLVGYDNTLAVLNMAQPTATLRILQLPLRFGQPPMQRNPGVFGGGAGVVAILHRDRDAVSVWNVESVEEVARFKVPHYLTLEATVDENGNHLHLVGITQAVHRIATYDLNSQTLEHEFDFGADWHFSDFDYAFDAPRNRLLVCGSDYRGSLCAGWVDLATEEVALLEQFPGGAHLLFRRSGLEQVEFEHESNQFAVYGSRSGGVFDAQTGRLICRFDLGLLFQTSTGVSYVCSSPGLKSVFHSGNLERGFKAEWESRRENVDFRGRLSVTQLPTMWATTMPLDDEIVAIEFADNQTKAFVATRKSVYLVDALQGLAEKRIESTRRINDIAVDASGLSVVVAAENTLSCWDSLSGRLIGTMADRLEIEIEGVVCTKDGTVLATGEYLSVRELATLRRELEQGGEVPVKMQSEPDADVASRELAGSLWIDCSRNGTVIGLREVSPNVLLAEIHYPPYSRSHGVILGQASGVALDCAGENCALIVQQPSQAVYVCDVRGTAGECVETITIDSPTVSAVCFAPGGERVMIGDSLGNLHVWVRPIQRMLLFKGGEASITAMACNDDGMLLTGDAHGVLRVWDGRRAPEKAHEMTKEEIAKKTWQDVLRIDKSSSHTTHSAASDRN